MPRSLYLLQPATLLVLLGLYVHTAVAGPALPEVVKGHRLWQQQCATCHAVDTDETGPRHRGAFGRRAGSVKDYDYSRALRRANFQWDAANLNRWLSDPESFIPGQNMDFKVTDEHDRAALIAYLESIAGTVTADAAAAER